MKRCTFMTILWAIGTVTPAWGANHLTNGSFEEGVNTGPNWVTLSAGHSGIVGWDIVAGNLDYMGPSYWSASDGDRSIDLNGRTAATLAQTFQTQPGTTYDVTFDLAGNPTASCGPLLKVLEISVGGQTQQITFDASVHRRPSIGWARFTFPFTATEPTSTLTFRSLIPGCAGPALDRIYVDVAAPSCPVQAETCNNGQDDDGDGDIDCADAECHLTAACSASHPHCSTSACNDGNECTIDNCGTTTMCVYTPTNAGGSCAGGTGSCNTNGECTSPAVQIHCAFAGHLKSAPHVWASSIEFTNDQSTPVRIYKLDETGAENEICGSPLAPGATHRESSSVSSYYLVKNDYGRCMGIYEVNHQVSTVHLVGP